jgi:hypothetical protein
MHSSRSRGHDGSPLLPLCHAWWIGVANVWALSPLIVSEALCGLFGKKPRRLARRVLSRMWVPNGCLGFPLRYK